jgi:protein-tyrosine phosphatase
LSADRADRPDAVGGPSARRVTLEGAHNVRDLGGFETSAGQTREHVLIRADNLDDLTATDVRRLTSEHRVGVVIDLRNPAEGPDPPRWVAGTGVDHHHVPLFDLSGETTAAAGEQLRRDVAYAYRRMFETAGPAIARVLTIITAERATGSVVVHCAAGKDRTGIVVAVLLRALGVAEDAVVGDYLATAERIDAVRASLRRREMYRPPPGAGPLPVMTAAPIEAVLAALRDEPRGADGYLARRGVTPGQLERFRQLMLTRP